MKRLTFSIPYNGDIGLTEWALQFEDIYEVYFQAPSLLDRSDPYPTDDTTRDYSEEGIVELARLCRDRGVHTNVLCNRALLFFDDVTPFCDFVERHRELIDAITVADPYGVPVLRERFPEIELQSSVYTMVDDKDKARTTLNLGISGICAPPSVNRRRSVLEELMTLKKHHPSFSLKLLASHACFNACVLYNRHSQLPVLREALDKGADAFQSAMGGDLDPFECTYPVTDLSDYIRRPFIRPEDVGYYEENALCDHLKLAFRNESTRELKTKIQAYMERSFHGDLFQIINLPKPTRITCDNQRIPKSFVSVVTACNRDHDDCQYCRNVTRDAVEAHHKSGALGLLLESGSVAVPVVIQRHRETDECLHHFGGFSLYIPTDELPYEDTAASRTVLRLFQMWFDRIIENEAPSSPQALHEGLIHRQEPLTFTVRARTGPREVTLRMRDLLIS